MLHAMSVRTRFAPSPTGFLHIGGARTALYNWLYARHFGGQFILRVEDTDTARSTTESASVILDGLKWLGLDWDEGPDVGGDYGPYRQSERREIYDARLETLDAAGLVYEDEGAIRFRAPDRVIEVHDGICSDFSVNLREQGSRRYDPETKREVEANPDLVIRRPDGSYIFHFVNVVDDIEMGITHVIRGEDHLSNTPKHLALFEALGAAPPAFAHIPLNLNESGTKMSKRDQGALIHEYREHGFLPAAVNNYMALLGWSAEDDREIFTLEELTERFDLPGVNRANSKFDFDKCKWVNAEHLKQLPVEQLRDYASPYLESAGIPADDSRVAPALELARERVQLLEEIPDVIGTIFADEVTYEEEALARIRDRDDLPDVIEALATALDKVESWNADGLEAGIKGAAESLGAKLGALMLPCRIAVTGRAGGADLVPMLELLGREEVVRRLRAFQRTVFS